MSDFPVRNKDFQTIKNIFQIEGYPFISQIKKSARFGHVLLIDSLTVVTSGARKKATVFETSLATNTAIKVNKGHDLTTSFFLRFDDNVKPQIPTSIDTSNPSFDVVNIPVPLGVEIPVNDYIYQDLDTDRLFSISVGTSFDNAFVTDKYAVTNIDLPANTAINIPFETILTYNEAIFFNEASGQPFANIEKVIQGIEIMGDANFQAPKVIYALGDSVMNFSNYINRFDGHFINIAKNHLNRNGLIYRATGDSMSGKTSTQLIETLKAGRKVITQADIVIFNHGINDAYQGTSDQEWSENIQYFIDWCKMFYKGAKIILLGATRLSNTQTTENARLDQLRAIEATFEDIPNKIYYYGLDTVVLPNYNPNAEYFSDTIHPTQASHDLYGDGLKNFLANIE